jgi:hypothetical protein
MSLHVWRRQHGGECLAQVEPVEGFGTWRIALCLMTNPKQRIITEPTALRRLEAAQAEADGLARRTFDHTCAPDTCGVWHPVAS